jgi:murein DD-endopeptidase MepM/ murein hydrolase activator NlpD
MLIVLVFGLFIVGCGPIDNPHKYSIQKISLPINESDYDTELQGIWPFCVHGGDHPEGHGGIDFDYKAGSKIISASSGKVTFIIDSKTPNQKLVAVEDVSFISVVYDGIVNPAVNIGDNVKIGDVIGDPVYLIKDNKHYVHFEVKNNKVGKRECPINYFDEESKTKLLGMFAKAKYPEQDKEPNICNCQFVELLN